MNEAITLATVYTASQGSKGGMQSSSGHLQSKTELSRNDTFETFVSADDTIDYTPQKRHWSVFLIVSIICFVVGCAFAGVNVSPVKSYYYACSTTMCYNVTMVLAFSFWLAILLLYLNATDKFDTFTNYLYSACGGKFKIYIVIAFVIFAISDVALLAISEQCKDSEEEVGDCVKPIIDPSKKILFDLGFRYVTRTLTAICGLLFFFLVLTYWNLVAYFCATNVWIHSLLYMTIIGYFFIAICRWLRPPPPAYKMKNNPFLWAWHVYHDPWKLISYIMIILFLCVFFFIGLATFLLVAFAEASKSSQSLGLSWWGPALLYSALALLMGITPLAPSTPVDASGGFLLTGVFVNSAGLTVYEAWALTLALVIVLHFIGSCLQYYMGKLAFIQFWANQWLPPDLLAASDSVLRYSNWFKVGMVGQVFLDTSNGLNQGRMNMDFCTQFWSEYASIPSAIGWVTTGAVLAISTFDDSESDEYSWASQAIVICIMIATLWQSIASTIGASALAQSVKEESFWTNREKWITSQYFYKHGVMVTKDGWKADVFELGRLFRHVQPVHDRYIKVSKDADTGAEERVYAKQYSLQLEDIRQRHYKKLGITAKNCERLFPGQLVPTGEVYESKNSNFWTREPHKKWKMACLLFFVILGIFTGGFAYNGITDGVSTRTAVRDGVDALDFSEENWNSWFCLAVFIAIYVAYCIVEIIGVLKQGFKIIRYTLFCGCCTSIDSTWETVYDIKHIKWKREEINASDDDMDAKSDTSGGQKSKNSRKKLKNKENKMMHEGLDISVSNGNLSAYSNNEHETYASSMHAMHGSPTTGPGSFYGGGSVVASSVKNSVHPVHSNSSQSGIEMSASRSTAHTQMAAGTQKKVSSIQVYNPNQNYGNNKGHRLMSSNTNTNISNASKLSPPGSPLQANQSHTSQHPQIHIYGGSENSIGSPHSMDSSIPPVPGASAAPSATGATGADEDSRIPGAYELGSEINIPSMAEPPNISVGGESIASVPQ